jgi:hypothetical protein
MSTKQRETFFTVIVFTSLIGLTGLGLALSNPHVVSASPGLPPRFTPVPGAPSSDGSDVSYITAWINCGEGCEIDSSWQPLYTVVQWQDNDGVWHDVQGWQSQLLVPEEQPAVQTWAVAPSHFGRGPFRWLVFDREMREVLGVSTTFYLPQTPNTAVSVEIDLVSSFALLPVTGDPQFPMTLAIAGLLFISALVVAAYRTRKVGDVRII